MKTYHGMCKYRQINFFPSVVKDVRPTYGNKEELAPLKINYSVLHIPLHGYLYGVAVHVSMFFIYNSSFIHIIIRPFVFMNWSFHNGSSCIDFRGVNWYWHQ